MISRLPKQHAGLSIVICVSVVVGLGILFVLPPEQIPLFPRCTFHWLTGLHCPGCGSSRAIHRLLHGDIVAAFRLNSLIIVLLPLTILGPITQCFGHKPWWEHRWAGWIIGALLIGFAVLRNLPSFWFLAPE
jgi:hypothetical protein